jgi:hypothetical protein
MPRIYCHCRFYFFMWFSTLKETKHFANPSHLIIKYETFCGRLESHTGINGLCFELFSDNQTGDQKETENRVFTSAAIRQSLIFGTVHVLAANSAWTLMNASLSQHVPLSLSLLPFHSLTVCAWLPGQKHWQVPLPISHESFKHISLCTLFFKFWLGSVEIYNIYQKAGSTWGCRLLN